MRTWTRTRCDVACRSFGEDALGSRGPRPPAGAPPLLAAAIVSLVTAIAFPPGAQAQVQRPSEERPELPDFVPEDDPALRLPDLPPRRPDVAPEGPTVPVERIEVRGSSVFTPEALSEITTPFEGRALGPSELANLRRALTELYVSHGYVTSGAVIPDQRLEDGVLRVDIVEGSLEEIAIAGNDRLRTGYLRGRLELASDTPLNASALQDQLQLLQRDPNLGRVQASLTPGSRRGLSRLDVAVEESRPYDLRLTGSNDRNPEVGSTGGKGYAEYRSLTGFGDRLSLEGEATEGFWAIDASFEVPVTAYDTRFRARYRRSRGEIVESPFDDLDVESTVQSFGFTLSHPVHRSATTELRLGITGEHRRTDTDYVFGSFDFIPGSEGGDVHVSVLRVFQEWSRRWPARALAARSTLNVGLDILDATTNGSGVPDSRFFSWLGQLVLAQQLPPELLSSQAIFRTDIQLANDPLFSIEQFAVGGVRTVRGYRENRIVRDNGWVSSLELRVPVLRRRDGNGLLFLMPFFDIGRGWNERREGFGLVEDETIGSLGVGARVQPWRWLFGQFYWGGKVFDLDNSRNADPQDDGFHFEVGMEIPW